jgi:tetratricopeptide (TPR) repeat protein
MVTSVVHYLNRKLAFRFADRRAFIVVVLILVTLTVLRNEIWRDETTLWADAIRKSPGRVRPYNLLSMAYFKRGEFEKAAEVGERAIRENPEIDFEFRELLGNSYVKLGRYDKAVESFMKSAEVHNVAGAYNNVGVTYLYMWEDLKQRKASLSEDEFQKQKTEILNNASRAFLKSLELNPDFLWGLDAYVNVHFDLGDTDIVRKTAETKLGEGERFDSLYILAKLLFNEGRFADALPYFDRAAVVVPQDKTALSLDPVFIEASHNLGLVYAAKNDFAAAEEAFTEALRTDPNHILTHLEIAKVYVRQGKANKAKEHLQFVLSRQPGNASALQLMQMIGY